MPVSLLASETTRKNKQASKRLKVFITIKLLKLRKDTHQK